MPQRFGAIAVALSFLLVASVGVLEATGAGLDDLMDAFFAASGVEAQREAIDRLVAAQIDAAVLADRLRTGRTYDDAVERGWSVYYNDCIDGVARPFHVFVPESYDPTVRHAVFVDLHGAVSHAPYPVESLISRRALWGPTAADLGWIVVMPHGDEGATWWSEVGRANLLAQLAFLKRTYNIDENRVFLSGFSDGASGALWMGFHDATAWAGFVVTYGHPATAGYGPYQTYPRNLLNRPIRASNGTYDSLYPSPEIELYIDQFLDLGVDVDWASHPTAHDIQALEFERPAIVSFVSTVARDPHPARVVWETSDVTVGRCDWVRIERIADVGDNLDFRDANVWPLKDEIRFGAAFAYRGPGQGFVVAGIEPGTIAHFSGVKTGDRIVRIDRFAIETGYEIPAIIEGKNPGDPIEIELIRGGEILVLRGEVTPIEPMYSRTAMTGSIEAVADGNRIDVTVRNVARYTLLLSSDRFDLDRPLVVSTNGLASFAGVVGPDVRFMLEQAANDDDRTTVYEARLSINLAPDEQTGEP